MRAIGIGCFWFSEIHDDISSFDRLITTRKFLEKVKSSLERVDNVSDVHVDGVITRFPSHHLSLKKREENEDAHLSFASLTFKIYVPSRLQEVYGASTVSYAENKVEHFTVDVRFEYHAPVVFIDTGDMPCEDESEILEIDPSTAVVFIRNYLQDKLQSIGEIRMHALGPSPFHADFFLSANCPDYDLEEINLAENSPGYATVLYRDSQGAYPAYNAFKDKFSDTISIFYYTMNLRFSAISHQVEAANCLAEIIATKEKLNWWNWYQRHLREQQRGNAIDSTLGHLISDRQVSIKLKNFIGESERKNLAFRNTIYWKSIQTELSIWPQLPHEEAREIIKIFEERRQKYFGNVSTVAGAIIGGIIGAIIGASLTFYLSQEAIQNAKLTSDTQQPAASIETPKAGTTTATSPPK